MDKLDQIVTKALSTTECTPTKASTTYSEEFIAFATFDTLGDPERQKLLDAATQWACAFANEESPYSLTLLGASGIGKTHLAMRLYAWAKNKFRPRYNDYGARIRETISYVRSQSACDRFLDGEYDLPEIMKNDDVLFVDDVGAERDPKGTWRTELQAVLDRRLGKWTVLTSNLSWTQLAEYDARMASRMLRNGGKVVRSKAEDYCLTQLKQSDS